MRTATKVSGTALAVLFLLAMAGGARAESLERIRNLAEQGDPEAQFYLGVAYDLGDGAPRDQPEAAKWYRKAAGQGLADAQLYLGVAYQEGRGVPRDYFEAVKWYRQAAEQGHAEGQFYLGVAYDKGQGVPQDDVHAHMWLNLAAAGGLSPAAERRELIASRMTPAQIAEAQKLAREWREKHPTR